MLCSTVVHNDMHIYIAANNATGYRFITRHLCARLALSSLGLSFNIFVQMMSAALSNRKVRKMHLKFCSPNDLWFIQTRQNAYSCRTTKTSNILSCNTVTTTLEVPDIILAGAFIYHLLTNSLIYLFALPGIRVPKWLTKRIPGSKNSITNRSSSCSERCLLV